MYIGNIVQEKIKKVEKKLVKKHGSDEIFSMGDAIEADESEQVSPMPKAYVSTAWMLHEIDGYAQDQKKMREVGDRLLEHLQNVRLDILAGEITAERMKHLKDALEDSKIELQFPELQEVVNDIKLRAEVELAKLEMSGV